MNPVEKEWVEQDLGPNKMKHYTLLLDHNDHAVKQLDNLQTNWVWIVVG